MSLQRAREAAAGGDWEAGYELLMKADSDGLLGPVELPLFAEVAYAPGHLDVTIEAAARCWVGRDKQQSWLGRVPPTG